MTTHESSAATATINFVVWIDDPAFRPWVRERSGRIADKHPSRMIVLDACPDATSGGDVVAMHGATPSTVLEAVQERLVSDLPTALWWTGDAVASEPVFDALLGVADAFVMDSSGATIGSETVAELATFLERHPTIAVRDLAWMRLHPWQDIIAQFFDDSTLREELFCIRQLRVVSGSEAEALYLGGWLGSRLGWRASAHNKFTDSSGSEIAFVRETSGRIRRVHLVEITTDNGVYRAAVSPDDETIAVLSTEGGTARPARLVPLQSIDNASLIERAILEPATDEVFDTALRMVGTLIG